LLRIEDFEMSSRIVKNDRLAVGADHQIIGVGNNELLLVAQHDPNRLKWVGLHQFFDLIGDHSLKLSPRLSKRQPSKLPSKLPSCRFCACGGKSAKNRIALGPRFAQYPPMLARVLSAAVNGLEAYPVEVEVNSGWGDTLVVLIMSISPI